MTASDPEGLSVEQSFDVAVRRVVVSLETAETTPLTEVGETTALSVSAIYSDGSTQTLDAALVQWQSSDPWVASVSEGLVTAVGGGNAMITAAYEGRTAETPVSVGISTRSTGSVRVLYAIPSDREFGAYTSGTIAHAMVDLQSWYRRELGGLTFSLYETTPEVCRMRQPADYYATGDSWDKVETGVQHCAPVSRETSDFTWVIYADVVEACDEPNELFAGWVGLTIVGRSNLEGIASPEGYYGCDEESPTETLGHFIGVIGHELGHTFALGHPPGCDQARFDICDSKLAESLMGFAYDKYPSTYLRTADKEIVMRSHFINPDLEPLTSPPAALGLGSFYGKYLDAGGLPVVASPEVPDEPLRTTRDIIDEMLALRGDLRSTIAAQGVRVAVIEEYSLPTALPEFSGLAGVSWDARGAVRATDARPVLVISEANLLCYSGDYSGDGFPYEDVFVREFAHAVLNMGVEQQSGGKEFRKRLEEGYEEALTAGLWENTYSGENPDEYWAEGVQSWFGLNDPPGENHNEINTRVELEAYDPILAALIREVFGDVTVSASCHETIDLKEKVVIRGVVTGPGGKPIGRLGLWAWQGDVTNSGHGEIGADGIFEIEVPNGTFTLDVYNFSGECSFVGWYDGDGSITTSDSKAARLVVDGASIEGIEIKLPANPDELPQVATCE